MATTLCWAHFSGKALADTIITTTLMPQPPQPSLTFNYHYPEQHQCTLLVQISPQPVLRCSIFMIFMSKMELHQALCPRFWSKTLTVHKVESSSLTLEVIRPQFSHRTAHRLWLLTGALNLVLLSQLWPPRLSVAPRPVSNLLTVELATVDSPQVEISTL